MKLILWKHCVTTRTDYVATDDHQWLAFMNVGMIFGLQKKEHLDQLGIYYLFKICMTSPESYSAIDRQLL
jgi:hypothetical protein